MLALRCTPEQFEMLRRAARLQGRSMSAWVREAIAAACYLIDMDFPPRPAAQSSSCGETKSTRTPRKAAHEGAKSAPALRTQSAATSPANGDAGEIVRCDTCNLIQYRTINSFCRKCGKRLPVEKG
jgi:hypothetical protein